MPFSSSACVVSESFEPQRENLVSVQNNEENVLFHIIEGQKDLVWLA
jgi:hypothetical protein